MSTLTDSFADAPAAASRYISVNDAPDPTESTDNPALAAPGGDPLAAADQMDFSGLGSTWAPGTQEPPPVSSSTPGDTSNPTDTSNVDWQPSSHGDSVGDQIVQYALKFRGVPYVYGGNGPTQFDCSGLTRYVYAHLGIDLPRVSYQQSNHGHRISLSQMKPGDLVAWDDSSRNPGADHIAIYIGDGRIIEAPHPGANVRVRKLGDWDQDAHAWGVRIAGVNGG